MTREMRNWRRFERLESRAMLAADVVTAVVKDHNLTITGDGNDDSFVVSGDGVAGDVVITGYTSSDGNGTQINGSQNGTAVTGTPDGSITLTGVTGNITINLGAGDATVGVINLTVDKNLSISAGDGDDTIDVGGSGIAPSSAYPPVAIPAVTAIPATSTENWVTVTGDLTITTGAGDDSILIGASVAAPYTGIVPETAGAASIGSAQAIVPVVPTNAVIVAGNLTITAGGGADSIVVGVGSESGVVVANFGQSTVSQADVTVSGTLAITIGNGNDIISEISLAVSRNETINAGSGNDQISVEGTPDFLLSNTNIDAANAVTIGRNLSISVGGGDDLINENGLTVAFNESITLGSGNDSVAIGSPARVSGPYVDFGSGVIQPAMPSISWSIPGLPVSIGRNLSVQMGSGDSSLSAGNVQVADTLLITGTAGLNSSANIASARFRAFRTPRRSTRAWQSHLRSRGWRRPTLLRQRHDYAHRRYGRRSWHLHRLCRRRHRQYPRFHFHRPGRWLGHRQGEPVDRRYHNETFHNPRWAGHQQHLHRFGRQQFCQSLHARFDAPSHGHLTHQSSAHDAHREAADGRQALLAINRR